MTQILDHLRYLNKSKSKSTYLRWRISWSLRPPQGNYGIRENIFFQFRYPQLLCCVQELCASNVSTTSALFQWTVGLNFHPARPGIWQTGPCCTPRFLSACFPLRSRGYRGIEADCAKLGKGWSRLPKFYNLHFSISKNNKTLYKLGLSSLCLWLTLPCWAVFVDSTHNNLDISQCPWRQQESVTQKFLIWWTITYFTSILHQINLTL